jgi:hypothetical protein
MGTTFLNCNSLYNISLEIGTSLDINEMLEHALKTFISELDLAGASALMFKDNQAEKAVYRKVHSIPKNIDSWPSF